VKAQDATQDEKVESKDNSDPKADAEDDSKHFDIFSFSIYVPRKAKLSKPGAEERAVDSTLDKENWSYVGVDNQSKQDNEPPAKRRRRSPRNAAATSQ